MIGAIQHMPRIDDTIVLAHDLLHIAYCKFGHVRRILEDLPHGVLRGERRQARYDAVRDPHLKQHVLHILPKVAYTELGTPVNSMILADS